MFTKKAAIQLVKDFVKDCEKVGVTFDRVILFGSYAKNEQRKYSDIDVALASDKFIGFGFEDRRFTAPINTKKKYLLIEPRTYPTDYFEKGDPFIDEIKKTGLEIKID